MMMSDGTEAEHELIKGGGGIREEVGTEEKLARLRRRGVMWAFRKKQQHDQKL